MGVLCKMFNVEEMTWKFAEVREQMYDALDVLRSWIRNGVRPGEEARFLDDGMLAKEAMWNVMKVHQMHRQMLDKDVDKMRSLGELKREKLKCKKLAVQAELRKQDEVIEETMDLLAEMLEYANRSHEVQACEPCEASMEPLEWTENEPAKRGDDELEWPLEEAEEVFSQLILEGAGEMPLFVAAMEGKHKPVFMEAKVNVFGASAESEDPGEAVGMQDDLSRLEADVTAIEGSEEPKFYEKDLNFFEDGCEPDRSSRKDAVVPSKATDASCFYSELKDESNGDPDSGEAIARIATMSDDPEEVGAEEMHREEFVSAEMWCRGKDAEIKRKMEEDIVVELARYGLEPDNMCVADGDALEVPGQVPRRPLDHQISLVIDVDLIGPLYKMRTLLQNAADLIGPLYRRTIEAVVCGQCTVDAL
ncbi:hypothetical protein L7F22_051194 [Adiantum nelumboides]|nr:hypothetical protein [Adiantum nelumboides]